MNLKERIEDAYDYLKTQLGESSTVRGLVQGLTVTGGLLANYPAETVALSAVILGALLKILLPDKLFGQ